MNTQPFHCHQCSHGGTVPHHRDCPHITLQDALYHMNYFRDEYRRVNHHRAEQTISAHRWEGKFRVVKHENNQLRRKMGARYPATPSAGSSISIGPGGIPPEKKGAPALLDINAYVQDVRSGCSPDIHQTTP